MFLESNVSILIVGVVSKLDNLNRDDKFKGFSIVLPYTFQSAQAPAISLEWAIGTILMTSQCLHLVYNSLTRRHSQL